jgi:Glycosyltransferase family 87
MSRLSLAVFDDRVGRCLLVAGLLLAGTLPTLRDGHLLDDMANYLLAAERLVRGDQIYVAGDLPYRYAPWFAVLWVPLAYVPVAILGAAWLTVLLASSAWLLWRAPWWLAIIAGPFVVWGASIGNAAPLMFATLALALPTRWAAVAIGFAASLKAFPILLVIPLLIQRRWRDVVIAFAVAVVLVAPMLLFDLTEYPVSSEGPQTIYNVLGPMAWLLTAAGAFALAVLYPSWRSSGLAVMLANPRLQWYDFGYLLIGEPRHSKGGLPRMGTREATSATHATK